ncbi:DUF7096 domain-containing protein [Halobellus ordinarius]|uniref:DUF7096 domain-containing protein n=1 Tax=Halobellus ordinarius TaxID=3075120 RepID=UPI0028809C54|nr:hypothetical protein [Halobellus sp. ZY16]
MRAVPIALALLLVLSAVAGAVPDAADSDRAQPTAPAVSATPAATPAQTDDPNVNGSKINVLGIPNEATDRSTLETEYVELGSGLSFSTTTTDTRLATESIVERIESAETTEVRQQYLLQEVSAIEQRIVSLRAEQRGVIASYGRGETSPRRLLYDLALIDAEARELERRRARLQSLSGSTPEFSISSSRFGNIELELNTLTGPIRGHAAAVLRGEVKSARFFVQSGDNSITLGVIRDGTYVRETYRGPLRGTNDGGFSLGDAVNATEAAYPTITAQRLRDDTLGNPDSDSARVTIEHERGRLVSFVDSGSRRVFKEYQYRPLDQVSTGSPTSAVKDGLRLTAYRTYPGGPVRLQLNSTDTDDPVDAQITVGPAGGRSSVVGTTGSDGSLWTLAPAGTYEVTAIDGSSVVLLTVEPTATPLVYGTVNGSSESDGTETVSPTPTG